MTRISNTITAFVAVFLCLNLAAECVYIPVDVNPEGPANIVAVGDSITEQNASGTTRYSWIFPLQDQLNATCSGGYQIAGKDSSPYTGYIGPSGYSLKRIAVGGFNTSGILNWMEAEPPAFGASVPDYVLYYLGVNNTWGGGWTSDNKGYNPTMGSDWLDRWEDDTTDIIALARAANPDVTFVIIAIQDMDGINATHKTNFDAINTRAATLASSLTTAQSPVLTTAQPDFVQADLYDNVHPVESGAIKIATTAYDVIQPLLNGEGRCN